MQHPNIFWHSMVTLMVELRLIIPASLPCISRIREYHDSKRLPPPHFSLAVSVGTGYFHKQKWNVGGNLDPMNIFMIKNLFELLLNAVRGGREEEIVIYLFLIFCCCHYFFLR